jgi:uncharacterized protein (TIGR00290 family)
VERPRPVLLSWSGGKDSTLALERLGRSADWRVARFLTTVTEQYDRISMHGVRRSLLEAQADALGLPLTVVSIPAAASNESYEDRMGVALEEVRAEGITTVGFGDLFLEDVRRYRETMLAPVGMEAVFPLWGLNTTELARGFVERGYRAILTCVDTSQIPGDFAGRDFDDPLLNDLPPAADPCGENGEFHTFVHDGPLFRHPVGCTRGGRVLREDRFMYQDLL